MRRLLFVLALLALPGLAFGQATYYPRVAQAEDTAHVSGDELSMCGVVRNDTLGKLDANSVNIGLLVPNLAQQGLTTCLKLFFDLITFRSDFFDRVKSLSLFIG